MSRPTRSRKRRKPPPAKCRARRPNTPTPTASPKRPLSVRLRYHDGAMASREKRAEPRPAPRLYLITPVVADPADFAPRLTAALAGAEIAAVLLRLADGDERTLINAIKALAPTVQDAAAALLIDG